MNKYRHRTVPALLAVVAVVAVTAAWTMGRPTPAATEDGIAVYFSPRGGCTEAIVDEIENAKGSILVQAYSFMSPRIAKALLDAHKRGVSVQVVLDSGQRTAQYSSATIFRNQGIPVRIDSEHAIAHNAVIVLDGKTVITGSFNFSKAAEERNAENLVIIKGKPKLAKAYSDNFAEHLGHSQPFEDSETVIVEEDSLRFEVLGWVLGPLVRGTWDIPPNSFEFDVIVTNTDPTKLVGFQTHFNRIVNDATGERRLGAGGFTCKDNFNNRFHLAEIHPRIDYFRDKLRPNQPVRLRLRFQGTPLDSTEYFVLEYRDSTKLVVPAQLKLTAEQAYERY